MRTVRDLLVRLLGRLVPSGYQGRLDRLSPEDQQTVMSNTFRSGM